MVRRSDNVLPLVAGLCLVVALAAGIYLALLTFGPMLPQLSAIVGEQGEQVPEYTTWDADAYPDYYRVAGRAVFLEGDESLAVGEIAYSELDGLGRAGRVVGRIDYPMMEAGIAREREDLQGRDPSGWGENAEADIDLGNGKTYHGYFWNRSHLLAKSLGGSDELANLICGTRTQNVGTNDGAGGMSYPESLARTWLMEHPGGSLLYAVTPVYEGRELVCRSVFVDVLSDDGMLDERIEVYNAARGYQIDYRTGDWWRSRG